MLGESTVMATVAVKDTEQAKQFYGGTLGLHQVDENPGGVTYESGSSRLFLYQAPSAGSGQATCATWEVDDVTATVDALKAKGVKFEHYDLPGATLEGDVHVWGVMKAAWFKDPDGNVLAIGNDGHAQEG